jgi:beta-lactam-binding protein with PASTA domain
LLKHFIIASVSALLFCFLIFWLISIYTNHNEVIAVPEFVGLKVDEATSKAEDEDLELIVTDSLYFEGQKPGVVLEQDPAKGADVKSGRKIYVVISSKNPPEVEVPDLNSFSEREAKAQLAMRGLKFGKIVRVPKFGAVFGVSKNGVDVPPRTKLPKGTVLDLKIGYTNQEADSIMNQYNEDEDF